MPRVIIEIGYEQYMLPSDSGVATILKAFASAQKLRHRFDPGDSNILLDNAPIKIGMQIVPGNFRPVKQTKAELEAERAAARKYIAEMEAREKAKNDAPEKEPPAPDKGWRERVEEMCAEPKPANIVPIGKPTPQHVIIFPMRANGGADPPAELPAGQRPALPGPKQLLLGE